MTEIRIVKISRKNKKIFKESDFISIKAKSKKDFLLQVAKYKNWELVGTSQLHKWFSD